MDVFEYAMKMELDGKASYERAAAASSDPALKTILLEMAEDEQKHYEVFKAYKDGAGGLAMPAATRVLGNAKNMFEKMAEGEVPEYSSDAAEIWKNLLEHEANAEKFYLEKAAEADDMVTRKSLEMIAAEEGRHRHLIENMIAFLEAPQHWLEDAEWHQLGAI